MAEICSAHLVLLKKIQNHKSATASKIALNILEKIIRKNTMGEDNEYEDD